MSRKGKVEPVILFQFCIVRMQGSELDEAMGKSRSICQDSWNKYLQTFKAWLKMNQNTKLIIDEKLQHFFLALFFNQDFFFFCNFFLFVAIYSTAESKTFDHTYKIRSSFKEVSH